MTVIDHSTILPTVAETIVERLKDVGVTLLDASISSGDESAIEGTLSIMVGSDENTLDDHLDVLEVMGDTTTHCGPSGASRTTKACNQTVVAAQMVGVCEVLVLADKAGVDLKAVVKAISCGAAGC